MHIIKVVIIASKYSPCPCSSLISLIPQTILNSQPRIRSSPVFNMISKNRLTDGYVNDGV